MDYKCIGAGLITLACGGFGISAAMAHRREEAALEQLIAVLDYMDAELQYHLTPLPSLCHQVAGQVTGIVRRLFLSLSEELESQLTPDVSGCMHAALATVPSLPTHARQAALQLGNSLGQFDLPGQLRGLDRVRTDCSRILGDLRKNRDVRLRSYQTLGFCAGAALAVLFV